METLPTSRPSPSKRLSNPTLLGSIIDEEEEEEEEEQKPQLESVSEQKNQSDHPALEEEKKKIGGEDDYVSVDYGVPIQSNNQLAKAQTPPLPQIGIEELSLAVQDWRTSDLPKLATQLLLNMPTLLHLGDPYETDFLDVISCRQQVISCCGAIAQAVKNVGASDDTDSIKPQIFEALASLEGALASFSHAVHEASIASLQNSEHGIYDNMRYLGGHGLVEEEDSDEDSESDPKRDSSILEESDETVADAEQVNNEENIVHMTLVVRVETDTLDQFERGELVYFDGLASNLTIFALKNLIAKRCGVVPDQQRLLFRDALLNDSITLNSTKYKFHSKDVITLFVDEEKAKDKKNKKFELNPKHLAREESERLLLMKMVKEGHLSVDDALSEMKCTPTANTIVKLHMPTAKIILRDEEEPDDSSDAASLPQGYVNVPTNKSRRTSPNKDKPVELASMSSAAFQLTKGRPSLCIVKEGRLTKEGGSHKSLKSRWFVLTNESLLYFKTSSDKSAIDELKLDEFIGCKVASEHKEPFCFGLHPLKADQRVYYIVCANEGEMRDWMDAINGCVPHQRTRRERLGLVQDCVGQLNVLGASQAEGIFRIPGNIANIKKLASSFERGEVFNAGEIVNVHTLASFIKKLFKEELVEPLISKNAQLLLAKSFSETQDTQLRIQHIQAVLDVVPREEKVVLRSIVRLFVQISENILVTGISTTEAGKTFGPALFVAMPPDRASLIFEFIVDHAAILFPEFSSSSSA